MSSGGHHSLDSAQGGGNSRVTGWGKGIPHLNLPAGVSEGLHQSWWGAWHGGLGSGERTVLLLGKEPYPGPQPDSALRRPCGLGCPHCSVPLFPHHKSEGSLGPNCGTSPTSPRFSFCQKLLPKGAGGGSTPDPQDTSAPFRTQAISAQMLEPVGFADLAGQKKGMGWADTCLPRAGRPSPDAGWVWRKLPVPR